MSDRGSFITEYIYCSKCLEIALEVFKQEGKYMDGQQLPCKWLPDADPKPYPIVAGKIGSSGGWAEEIYEFENRYIPELEKRICHPIRIAVIPETEGSERIFIAKPNQADIRLDPRGNTTGKVDERTRT